MKPFWGDIANFQRFDVALCENCEQYSRFSRTSDLIEEVLHVLVPCKNASEKRISFRPQCYVLNLSAANYSGDDVTILLTLSLVIINVFL